MGNKLIIKNADFHENAVEAASIYPYVESIAIVNHWSINSSTGAHSSSSKIVSSNNTDIGDALSIDVVPPVHYASNGYYKWKISWYSGSAYIGIASEQTDFDTHTHFAVPNNAATFVISVASVKGSTTENFPYDKLSTIDIVFNDEV